MMLYKIMKVNVCCLDGGTDYFDIEACVLQGDTLAPYLFIIYLNYVLRMSIDIIIDNCFKLAKERSWRYPTQTITVADYADDMALLANTSALDETLLHSLKRAAAGMGLHVNADKMEYVCLSQRGDISILNGTSLKLVDTFTYQGSSVSSTEKDINMQLAKAWTVIGRLLVIWKSDQTDKIKYCFFFQTLYMLTLLYGCAWWMITKLDGNFSRILEAVLN